MYGEVDDLLAKTLDRILLTDTMNGRELTLMIYLVSLMKWRIPKVDLSVKDLVKDIPIENLGIAIRPVDSKAKVSAEAIKQIHSSEIVAETKRLLLSVQPLLNKDRLDEIHKNSFITSYEKFPALLGDCPIIESANSGFETLENFIFPLSSNATLICKRGVEKYISNPLFYIQNAQIQFKEIINEEWLDSYWYHIVTKRFFFVVFQKDESDELRLKKAMFWTMPPADIKIAEAFWLDTKNKIENDDYTHFIKISDDMICHVRPKGINSNDLMETPSKRLEKKKCYWLNSKYIKNVIES